MVTNQQLAQQIADSRRELNSGDLAELVVALTERVDALEATAADHEARITALEP